MRRRGALSSPIRARWVVLLGVGGIFLASAAQASATTTPVRMAFTEQIVPNFKQGCPVFPEGFCGNGVVVPFGHVTETIEFGAGCGDGSCDLRTIYLPGGSIVSNEEFLDAVCRGICQPNRAEPVIGSLSDTIDHGTGAFSGATGSFSGTVTGAGPSSTLQFTGTITLP